MNRFRCNSCGGDQYTAADTAQVCIYCGNETLEKMDTLEPDDVEDHWPCPTCGNLISGY